MKTRLSLLAVLASLMVQAQSFSVTWEKAHGGSGYDGGRFVRQETGNDYLTVGTTNSTDGNITSWYGSYDIAVFHLDASGNIQQSFTYGGSADDYGVRLLYDNNGTYFLIGFTASNDGIATYNHGLYDYWIISGQTNGTVNWQEVYGGSNVDAVRDALMTPSGHIIMA